MLGLLSKFGLGEQLMTAAVLAMAGWYLLRGKSLFTTIAHTMGTAATIAMGVLGVLAVGIGLGWFDPQPGVFVNHAVTVAGSVMEFVGGRLGDMIQGVMP